MHPLPPSPSARLRPVEASQLSIAHPVEPANGPSAGTYLFGQFELRPRERVLLSAGCPVELGSRAFDVLLALIEAGGTMVTKTVLLDRVWSGVVVEENNLQVQISTIRRALGPDHREWITTIPGRGYRFTGKATAIEAQTATLPPVVLDTPTGDGAAQMSIIVLPFAGRGDDPASAWFADGVTDSLTTDLARALPPGSVVIAQTTADIYKGAPADVREIGRENSVRYVVEGSVFLTNDQARVNVQLIAADTGAHLWADRFDTPRRGVLGLQDEIVGRLSRSVGREMIDAEARRAEQSESDNPETDVTTQDHILRAHAAASQRMMTRAKFEAACDLYNAALTREPDNADALAGIAAARLYQVLNGRLEEGGTDQDEAQLNDAEAKLRQVLTAAPDHLAAIKTRAVLLRARGVFVDAIAWGERFLAHNPGDPAVHREVGLNLLYLGRAADAETWFRRADALGPDDPARWTWLQGLGRTLIQLGRDAEAADALRLAIVSNPNHAPLHALLGAALLLAGDPGSASAAVAGFRLADPGCPIEAIATRSAVPIEATAASYRERNQRLAYGLRRAAALTPQLTADQTHAFAAVP